MCQTNEIHQNKSSALLHGAGFDVLGKKNPSYGYFADGSK